MIFSNKCNKYLILLLLLFLIMVIVSGFNFVSIRENWEPLNMKPLDKDNTFYPCENFCGPKAQCAITREQCVADFECQGCLSYGSDIKDAYNVRQAIKDTTDDIISEGFTNNSNPKENLKMYNSLETSSLTTDRSNIATVIEKDATIPKMNIGADLWTKAFNYGLKLSESKLKYDYERHPDEFINVPKYKVTESATGLFYDTGPTASNASL